MPDNYPWYTLINEDMVLQGDIFEFFDILVPIEAEVDENNTINSKIEQYNVIVMSQSCDLEASKIDFVLLCPVIDVDVFTEQASGAFKGRKGLEQIRRGVIPGLHMIAECNLDNCLRPIRIVNFHKIFSMPINYVKEIAQKNGDRIRLCPPYREHLAQSFARYFMRVGLPIDIPKF